MQVRLLFFGILRETMGVAEGQMTLGDGCDVAELLRKLRERNPEAAAALDSIAVAVNQEYVTPAHVLEEGDEIAILPPVSGGAPPRAWLTREAIDQATVLAGLAQAEDGAVCTFAGIVRGVNRGREVLHLEYEAYEEMALRSTEALVERAMAEHGAHDVRVVHRLGRLGVGEASIFIATVSPHRAQAFAACRFLIDEIKRTVPIWKKEVFADGAEWAAGEPFPAEAAAR